MLSLVCVCVMCIVISSCQVLLVTGGWTGSDYQDSTELLAPGSDSWRLATGLLPRPMDGLSVTTVANTLYATGTLVILLLYVTWYLVLKFISRWL